MADYILKRRHSRGVRDKAFGGYGHVWSPWRTVSRHKSPEEAGPVEHVRSRRGGCQWAVFHKGERGTVCANARGSHWRSGKHADKCQQCDEERRAQKGA